MNNDIIHNVSFVLAIIMAALSTYGIVEANDLSANNIVYAVIYVINAMFFFFVFISIPGLLVFVFNIVFVFAYAILGSAFIIIFLLSLLHLL